MARALSNLLLKGITGSPAVCSNRMASASFIQRGMRYSTTVPNDPDTHDDFKLMDKLRDSATSLKDVVEQDVKENPVMIYMKRVPEFLQCGFSSLAVRVLKHYKSFERPALQTLRDVSVYAFSLQATLFDTRELPLCQPWTITLTGMLAITGSWLILHSMLVTTIISLLICSWWYIFLYSYPKAYTDMIAERRKRVRSGIEDIFGSTKADGIDQTSN